MDLLKLIETFVEVAEHNSFSVAAERMDISLSVVSRQIANLEKYLGARLFNRTTRSVSLTGDGQEYYGRVQQILGDLKDAEAIIGQNSQSPAGKLRISAPLSFGIAKLGPIMARFIETYPNIEPDIDLNDRLIDLTDDRIDVAIRIATNLNESLIVRKISTIGVKVCASPSYINKKGIPETPHDLINHNVLSYTYLATDGIWYFRHKNDALCKIKLPQSVKSNNGDILTQMASFGAGVVIQPSFIVEKEIKEGRLVEILKEWKIKEFNLYAVFLSRRFMPSKIRAFIDFLVKELGQKTL